MTRTGERADPGDDSVRDVELICSSSGEHLSQIYSGFALLAARGLARVTLRRSTNYDGGCEGAILRAVIDGNRVVYDTRDHASFPPEDLEWATHYFKRSFLPSRVQSSGRSAIIKPLGLNYSVYAPGDWWCRRAWWSAVSARPANARGALQRIAGLTPGISRVTAPGRANSSVTAFEQSPEFPGERVLLLTRTWDPGRAVGEQAEMRAAMNTTRAEGIRLLRRELGPVFIGGLAPWPSAIRDFPDLVVDPKLTKKGAYLRTMRSSSICITSQGLLGTNGWRLAEYVAGSRAVVNERLQHVVPGQFLDGVNFLSYSSPQELATQVHRLLEDDDLRYQARMANRAYYQTYVRPDALIERTLEYLP